MPNSSPLLKGTMLFHASVPSNILSSAHENLASLFLCFEGAVLYLIALALQYGIGIGVKRPDAGVRLLEFKFWISV